MKSRPTRRRSDLDQVPPLATTVSRSKIASCIRGSPPPGPHRCPARSGGMANKPRTSPTVSSRPSVAGNGRATWISVAIPAAISILAEVAGRREIGDDRVSAAFGDVEATSDITQPDSWIVSYAQQRKCVVREKLHAGIHYPIIITRNKLLVP